MIDTVSLDWRFGTIELPAADRYIRQAIDVTGEYSGAKIDLYQAILRPGDVALDVGANVGVLSVAMGLAVGPGGRVLAFEPQPQIFAILNRNLAVHDLPQVQARREIVGRTDGHGEFVDLHSLPAGTPFNFGGLSIASRTYAEYGDMVATPARSVDALRLERCDFIKVDVEGAELQVLAGASRTLAACRPVLSLECDRPELVAPAIDELRERGYRLWRFRGFNTRAPNPKGVSVDGEARISILMLLAVPEERLDVLDRIDRSALQAVADRAAFERLSQGIVKDGA